jgi:hypothetical protein
VAKSSVGPCAIAILLGILSIQRVTVAADSEPHEMALSSQAPTADDKKLIGSAMRAAPKKVSGTATIVAMNRAGELRTIRKGTNGFTCMPDNPASPGPDPMCLDKAAMQWAEAWIGHKSPPRGKAGLIYMLSGGTDASNTDPYAAKPSTGNHWVQTGPHIMVVGADADFYSLYPKAADPDTSVPYVMWAGTPYEHLMIPIR